MAETNSPAFPVKMLALKHKWIILFFSHIITLFSSVVMLSGQQQIMMHSHKSSSKQTYQMLSVLKKKIFFRMVLGSLNGPIHTCTVCLQVYKNLTLTYTFRFQTPKNLINRGLKNQGSWYVMVMIILII